MGGTDRAAVVAKHASVAVALMGGLWLLDGIGIMASPLYQLAVAEPSQASPSQGASVGPRRTKRTAGCAAAQATAGYKRVRSRCEMCENASVAFVLAKEICVAETNACAVRDL
jgi:hypothetical protein